MIFEHRKIFVELKFLLLVSILVVKSLGQLKLIFILWLCKFLFRQNLCHRTFWNISNIFWRARVGSGYLLIDLLINRSRLLFAVIIVMQINFQIYLLRKWLQFREYTTECNQNAYNYKRIFKRIEFIRINWGGPLWSMGLGRPDYNAVGPDSQPSSGTINPNKSPFLSQWDPVSRSFPSLLYAYLGFWIEWLTRIWFFEKDWLK